MDIKGYSVKEIITKYERYLIKIEKTVLQKVEIQKKLFVITKIKEHLNWKPKYNNLEEMIKSFINGIKVFLY